MLIFFSSNRALLVGSLDFGIAHLCDESDEPRHCENEKGRKETKKRRSKGVEKKVSNEGHGVPSPDIGPTYTIIWGERKGAVQK